MSDIELKDIHRSLLRKYSRAIVHMRKQVSLNRFGLFFGSGINNSFDSFKIPTWEKLITLIANDPEIDGESILEIKPHTGLPYCTQMLFEYFKQKQYKKIYPHNQHSKEIDYKISSKWLEIVRKHIYEKVPSINKDNKDLFTEHDYIYQYLPLIKMSNMTVTYNFDNLIEQMLYFNRDEKQPESRGYESVTNPWTQFRRQNAIIYHPNGVIPQNPFETPSDRFVFSEASYAEQLIGIFAGYQSGLINHLSKHTCLLIGLSLADETLRNVLIQSARECPGNFHYYIHFLKDNKELNEYEKESIKFTNFTVYNLITLYLNEDEIRALGELINSKECINEKFYYFCVGKEDENEIRTCYRFYLTGPLGVGKSSALNNFRNLSAIDEWFEPRPIVLKKVGKELSENEKKEADNFIIRQFKQREIILRRDENNEGIFILDRGALDPIAFTKEKEWNSKAKKILDNLCRKNKNEEVCDGKVILLKGDPYELFLRMVKTQREDYTSEKLSTMERDLERIYGKNGVVFIDTNGMTPSDVTRRIAEIIHLEDYVPICNLHHRLELIKKEGFNVSD